MSTFTPSAGPGTGADDRLESWKEIAVFLRRDIRTVQRWEKTENMPVHRHVHDKLGSVYAFRSELTEWQRQRSADGDDPVAESEEQVETAPPGAQAKPRFQWWYALIAVVCLAAVGTAIYLIRRSDADV